MFQELAAKKVDMIKSGDDRKNGTVAKISPTLSRVIDEGPQAQHPCAGAHRGFGGRQVSFAGQGSTVFHMIRDKDVDASFMGGSKRGRTSSSTDAMGRKRAGRFVCGTAG